MASLWKVPDAATRDLMDRFYDSLWNREMGKLPALCEAPLWMLRGRGPRGADLLDEQKTAKTSATLLLGGLRTEWRLEIAGAAGW